MPSLFTPAVWIATVALGPLGSGCGREPHEVEHAAAEAEQFHLKLAWPDAGSVRMTVEFARGTDAGRYRCSLSWAPDAEAVDGADSDRPDRIVRYSDFEFLELNGKQQGDPGFAAMNNALAPALAAVPPFRVTADGEFVGLVDLDGKLEELAAAYEGLAPGAFETIRALLDDPLKRSMIESSTAEDWSWWGSFWNDYETGAGEVIASPISLPSGLTGNPIAGMLTMECLDRHVRAGVEAVHMRARTEYDPGDMLRVTLATLRMMSGIEVPDDAIVAVSRGDEVDGIYTVEGLRPLEVRWSKTITVDDGSGPAESVETKHWTFDWTE
jgi:hypothetical protein